jgi:DNA repair photolyase
MKPDELSIGIQDRAISSLPQVKYEMGRAAGPIETEMREKIAKLKNCAYPDTFDWAIYDRIANKFSEPPRGGVVFNTTFKLANWHPTCSKCHYSFELDTYGRGCFHNCEYCYAKDQLSTHGYWNNPQPFPVNLADVRKVFYTVFETDRKTKWRSIMERRVPLRLGSMSDSFMLIDRQIGVTKELLKILKFYRYPYTIFTRSPLVADDDYLQMLDKRIAQVQFSITGNKEVIIQKLEPGAARYKKRLKALKKLSVAGFSTAVRINPLFPRYPDGFFTDPGYIQQRFGGRECVPELRLYDEQFIPDLSEAGVLTVIVGFVRLSMTSANRISSVLGLDVKSMFRQEKLGKNGFSECRYSDSEISHYYKWFSNMCREQNLRFSTCYIGNGIKDYFQYQSLWSNKADCCDALGSVSAIQKTCQSIDWTTRKTLAPSMRLAEQAHQAEQNVDFETAPPDTSMLLN